MQQQFAIGVNDVTRVLERMIQEEADCQAKKEQSNINLRRAPLVPLQVMFFLRCLLCLYFYAQNNDVEH